MVEHAAVNRGVVGSSPTSGANFPKENGQSGFSAQILHTKTPNSPYPKVMLCCGIRGLRESQCFSWELMGQWGRSEVPLSLLSP